MRKSPETSRIAAIARNRMVTGHLHVGFESEPFVAAAHRTVA
jgi:hypothetical protein